MNVADGQPKKIIPSPKMSSGKGITISTQEEQYLSSVTAVYSYIT